jgi:16S rRNA (guanine527-N7)-methyltransferase
LGELEDLAARVRAGAGALGIEVGPGLLEAFEVHARLLRRWQGRVRLVGDAGVEVLASRHYLDALTLDLVDGSRDVGTAVDLGSGAGFPGLVLALCWPEVRWTLVDSDGRKAAFLNAAVAALSLAPRVRVVTSRAGEEAGGEEIELADLVVSRAVWGPREVLDRMARYRAPGGRVATFLGKDRGALEVLEARAARLGIRRAGGWQGEVPGAGHRRVDLWG